LSGDDRHCTISDNGPGLSEKTLLQVFAVNRPLLSSKFVRLPTRGMLGNGLRVLMGAVAAYRGTITLTSRGQTYELSTDSLTGATNLLSKSPAPEQPGPTVTITFPRSHFTYTDFHYGRLTIRLAQDGEPYRGHSQPNWYSEEALC